MNPLKNILTINSFIFFIFIDYYSYNLLLCLQFNRLSFYEYDIIFLNHKMALKDKENDIIIVGGLMALNGLIPNIIFNKTKPKPSNLALFANNR